VNGWRLILAAILVVAWLLVRRVNWAGALGDLIERRLGGYRQEANAVDRGLPRMLTGEPPRVAVLGGGLAGVGAAAALGERGLAVTLFERNEYLGGKIGAWKVAVGEGEHVTIEMPASSSCSLSRWG